LSELLRDEVLLGDLATVASGLHQEVGLDIPHTCTTATEVAPGCPKVVEFSSRIAIPPHHLERDPVRRARAISATEVSGRVDHDSLDDHHQDHPAVG
jgi:hypothetical protein